MGTAVKVIVALLILGSFAALALLASLVGGITIRSVGQSQQLPTFALPAALLPGVPVVVPVASLGVLDDVIVALRTREETLAVVQRLVRRTEQGAVVFILPCETSPQQATIVLLDAATKQVLTHSNAIVQILPPGPDCVLAPS